jgi:hypothetical protein
MNNNLEIYNSVRKVPQEAQKSIQGGRLKGMTDINPMWRIKALTEQFGPVGIGWKYTITDKKLEHGANDEIAAFVDIDLFIKYDGQWSEAIPGTGGSMFVSKEKNGLYTSDECFKMALTDAISVACKALGFGADVYWEKDRSKYSSNNSDDSEQPKVDEVKAKALEALILKKGKKTSGCLSGAGVTAITEMTMEQYMKAWKYYESLQDKAV